MMPANPQAISVFSTSPVYDTFSSTYGTSFSCMRHISCMIHVIKRGFLIGARSDLLGGLSIPPSITGTLSSRFMLPKFLLWSPHMSLFIIRIIAPF